MHIVRYKNTLDCNQFNYSSRIVFSYIDIVSDPTRNSAIRSADSENPTLKPNMKWIAIRNFPYERSVSSSSVGRQYTI